MSDEDMKTFMLVILCTLGLLLATLTFAASIMLVREVVRIWKWQPPSKEIP